MGGEYQPRQDLANHEFGISRERLLKLAETECQTQCDEMCRNWPVGLFDKVQKGILSQSSVKILTGQYVHYMKHVSGNDDDGMSFEICKANRIYQMLNEH